MTFFIVSKLLGSLADPGTLLGIIVILNGLATWLRRRRFALMLQCAAILLVVLFSFPPLTNGLAASLESRFPASPILPLNIAGIIVLGGTERVEPSAYWHEPVLSDPGPIAAMLKLARQHPEAKLVFSGGGHADENPQVSEAAIVRDFVNEVGGDGNKIQLEERSLNTYQNAAFSFDKFRPKNDETWVLVCQAIGMPRAVGVFRRAGWHVIAFPAGYLSSSGNQAALSFSLLGSLSLASMTMHEWAGLVVYRLMGYTDALFPG